MALLAKKDGCLIEVTGPPHLFPKYAWITNQYKIVVGFGKGNSDGEAIRKAVKEAEINEPKTAQIIRAAIAAMPVPVSLNLKDD